MVGMGYSGRIGRDCSVWNWVIWGRMKKWEGLGVSVVDGHTMVG